MQRGGARAAGGRALGTRRRGHRQALGDGAVGLVRLRHVPPAERPVRLEGKDERAPVDPRGGEAADSHLAAPPDDGGEEARDDVLLELGGEREVLA